MCKQFLYVNDDHHNLGVCMKTGKVIDCGGDKKICTEKSLRKEKRRKQ